VLVRVEAAGICGTDVDEVLHGPITVPVRPHPVNGRSAPMTLGHENVGIVSEAGPASGVAVGTRVVPWPLRPCGRCRDCVTGHANRCSLMVSLGMSADGGMADYLVVEGSGCVPVGTDIALERAVLVEPFAVALHAVHQVEVTGRRVAIVGIGSLGLCVVEAAILAGAAEVIAVSRSEVARTAALDAGATAAVPLEDAPDVDAEVALETAGAAQAIVASFEAVRRGGRILVLGGHPRPVEIGLQDLTIREIALQGSVSHCFADFVAAANAITAGDLARARRRVQFAPLESAPALLRAEGSTTKRILVPSQA
jgi:(R,R)-butanediol dehydrogenase/meso-butanediol dehydrogenase/diacetyl reductase